MMINRHKHIFGIAHNIYVSRLVSFIRALRDEAIRKMSFEYARLREAGKHFLGGLGVCYSIGIRSNRQNNPFHKRYSFIQSSLVYFTIMKNLPYNFPSPSGACEKWQKQPAKFQKMYNSTICKEKCGSQQRRFSIFVKRMRHYIKINHCYQWEANNKQKVYFFAPWRVSA